MWSIKTKFKTMKELKKILIIGLLALCSCGKEFLNIKRDGSQVIPHTLSEYQSILDNVELFNFDSGNRLAVIGGDEYFLSDESYASLQTPYERNGYIWNTDVYEGLSVHDWNIAYHRILLANMVLDGIAGKQYETVEEDNLDHVKGNALFIRGYNFYQLAQLFCKPFNQEAADVDLGLPLKLNADISIAIPRSSLMATYQQIIVDFKQAANLLPEDAGNLYQPSKTAAYAMLAKTYLNMGDFENGAIASETALSLKNTLINYNDIDIEAELPFPMLPMTKEENPEIIYFSMMSNIPIVQETRFNADTVLLSLYEDGDLRRSAFYQQVVDGRIVFKGSYVGGGPYALFSGLAVDEVYLIAAECHVRQGDVQQALKRMNHLRSHRFRNTIFEPLGNLTHEEMLLFIIRERRRELVLRGTCWEDVRRLSGDARYARSLKRILKDQMFTLEPGSPKLVWPVPEDEIAVNNLRQNER